VDAKFNELTGELTNPQKEILTKRYGKKEALVKLEKRMEAIATGRYCHSKRNFS
jgi:hypothetical protein